MWVGNPVVAAGPAIPWLLDGHAQAVAETLANVQDSIPADAIVIPGHGKPNTPDLFNWSIGYLNALIGDVQASIDEGNDAKATPYAKRIYQMDGVLIQFILIFTSKDIFHPAASGTHLGLCRLGQRLTGNRTRIHI